MILDLFALNKVWCIISTRGGVNRDYGDNFWETGPFRVSVSDGLSNLEGGVGVGRWIFVLLICLGREKDIVRGWVGGIVHLVLETDIQAICCGMGNSCSWYRGGIRVDGLIVF